MDSALTHGDLPFSVWGGTLLENASDLYPAITSYHKAYRWIGNFLLDSQQFLIFSLDKPILKDSYEFKFSFGTKGSDHGEFRCPFGIAIDDNDHLFISDAHQHRIQVFEANGTFIRVFGRQGSEEGQFSFPVSLAFDTAGNLVIVENGNHRVQVVDPQGKHILKFGGYGKTDGFLYSPYGVAISPEDDIIIADSGHNKVQIFSSLGVWKKTIGEGLVSYPSGLVVTVDGHLVVVDHSNHKIQVFDSDGNVILVFGSEVLRSPWGILQDRLGRYCVVDDSLQMWVFSRDGEQITNHTYKLKDRWGPRTLAQDKQGNLIVVDYGNHMVQVFE